MQTHSITASQPSLKKNAVFNYGFTTLMAQLCNIILHAKTILEYPLCPKIWKCQMIHHHHRIFKPLKVETSYLNRWHRKKRKTDRKQLTANNPQNHYILTINIYRRHKMVIYILKIKITSVLSIHTIYTTDFNLA